MTLLEPTPTEALQAARSPVLKTRRLVLRAPVPDDAKALAALMNDRRIAENTARVPHPYTLKDAETFIDHVAGGSEVAFLVTLTDGRIVGNCGIATIRADGPEIGYAIGVAHWGHGYATEAARAIIDPAFRDIGVKELLAGAQGVEPGLAARLGEVRLPVDRRGAAARPRHQLLGAVRPVSGSIAGCGHRCGIGARCA
jgi:RimJ/RimL family protein N-acetyltransferase